MRLPEGFTATQLGLPEDDGIRTIERPSTGMWHVMLQMHRGDGMQPATVFAGKSGHVSVYADGWLSITWPGHEFDVLHAPDDAIAALKRDGWPFTDRR